MVPSLAPSSEGVSYRSEPIVVEGNGGFIAAGFTGSGSAEDPYVLSEINLDSSLELYGIRVSNTTAHFRIEGCTVHDSYSPDRDPLNLSASGSGILLINVTNVVIEDYLGDFNVRGITVVDSSNVVVNGSRFNNNIEAGVHLMDCLDENVKVTNSTFTVGTGDDGVLIEHCNGVEVSGNIIHGGENGIAVRAGGLGSGGHLLVDNELTGQSLNSILLGGSTLTEGDMVLNNTVRGNGAPGITISFATSAEISGNDISGCPQGIIVDWSGNLISGNVLSNNPQGVQVRADGNLISGNTIMDGKLGVWIYPSQGNQILNNTILRMDEVSAAGIYLGIGEVRDILIVGNDISFCYEGIRAATGTGQEITGLLIANNTIGSSIANGTYLLRTADSRLINNSFSSGGGNGLYIGAGCHDLHLEGNEASNNRGAGLYIRDADDNTVTGNLFVSNAREGIYLDRGSGNVMHGNALLFNKDSGRLYSPLRPQAFCGEEGNNWSLGTGNLWADWLSPDDDDDGIVDLPYNLTGGFQDQFPLTSIVGLVIPADITPPEIVAYAPEGLDAEQGDAISITFSEDMNISSVVVMVNNAHANGSWNDRTFVLGLSLEYETEYAVTVTGQDLSGNEMPEFIWSFRVEDRNATITGRVIDEDGNPLEGVVVIIGGARTNTTVDGYFSLEVPPGNYSIGFLKDDYTARPLTVEVLPGEDHNIGDIEMVYDDPGASSGLSSFNGYVVLAIIILIAAGLGGLWFWRRKK
jgi:parallel beta-helix repeat protein